MIRDPLSFFVHEKVADAGAPQTPVDEFHRISSKPSDQSIDPGERALAGMAAISGSLSAKIVPFLAEAKVVQYATKGDVPWPRPGGIAVSSIGEALRSELDGPKSRFMGLFDIEGREMSRKEWLSDATEKKRLAFGSKLMEVEDIADSFIDKHHLKEKGVKIHMRQGYLSGTVSGQYFPSTKRIYIPRIGKVSLLHELGHAADYTTRIGRIRKFIEPAIRKSVLLGLPIALAAGDQIKEMIPGTIDDKAISFMQENAPGIMGATLAATVIYPEAKASMLALQHVRQKEGPRAAKALAKKLGPMLGTYILGAIPAIIGMSLARKYMREARGEKAEVAPDINKMIGELEKNSSLRQEFVHHGKDIAHVAKSIARGTAGMISGPGTMRRIVQAAKEVGTSPEFVHGAVVSAVPAGLAALYMYATPGGEITRTRLEDTPDAMSKMSPGRRTVSKLSKDGWIEEHPLRFAGLVALGAAMSGGLLSKFMRDLTPLL